MKDYFAILLILNIALIVKSAITDMKMKVLETIIEDFRNTLKKKGEKEE